MGSAKSGLKKPSENLKITVVEVKKLSLYIKKRSRCRRRHHVQ